MKKKISLLLVLMMSFTLICGSIVTVNAASKPTKMTISASSKVLYAGTTAQLKVKSVKPAKASKAVTYKSNDENIVTVSSKGVVTAQNCGEATITVTSKSNKKLKKTVKFVVLDQAEEKIESLNGLTFANDFDVFQGGDFIFVKNCSVQKFFFNRTDHSMIIFNDGVSKLNNKFGKSAYCCIENDLKLGLDEVGAMPKFSGGKYFKCTGCGSMTAFADTSLNDTPIALNKKSITTGKYYSLKDHSELKKAPKKIKAIEIIQYYEGGEYKVAINGMA